MLCEINKNQEACESFVEAINTMVSDIFSEPGISLSEAESRVFEGFRLISQKFLEMFLSCQANEGPSEPIECPECGQACRRYKRKRRITTLCGVIGVERWVYGCASGHYHVQWDNKQELTGQYTRRVVEVICRLAVRLDFREASEELSYYGIKVSHEIVHRIVDAFSEGLNIPQQAETQKLESNQRLKF